MSFNTYRAHTDGVAAVSPTWRSWPTDAEQPVNSLIAIWAHNDGGGTVITISDSHASDPNLGWVELFGPNPSNSGTRTALFYRRRTGAVIPEPVLSGSNDEWVCYAEVMPWAAPTTAIDAAAVTNQTSSTTVPAAAAVRTELTTELGQVTATKNLVEADEYHTATTVEKRLKGTNTVLLTKNHSGTPLNNLQVVEP
jgi:hypothetical protein